MHVWTDNGYFITHISTRRPVIISKRALLDMFESTGVIKRYLSLRNSNEFQNASFLAPNSISFSYHISPKTHRAPNTTLIILLMCWIWLVKFWLGVFLQKIFYEIWRERVGNESNTISMRIGFDGVEEAML